MKARLAEVRWDLVLKTSAVIYVVTLVLGLALSFPLLAIFNVGHLDSQSAARASTFITAFVVIVVTGYGAWWVARRLERAALLHGFLVGLILALISFVLDALFLDLLVGRAIEVVGLVYYALMVAAGLLGGALGSRRQEQA